MLESAESRSLDKDIVRRAIRALQSYLKKTSAERRPQSLLDDDQFYLLCINLFQAPAKANPRPIRIEIPHSLYLDNSQICLITKDPQSEHKQRLQTHPVQSYAKVIGVSKLKRKFPQYKDKRELAASYDLFVADDRVLSLLPNLLGNAFFHRKKQPVPVRISKEKYATSELEKARDSTYMFRTAGSSTTVKVGRANQSTGDLVQNVLGAMSGIIRHVPGGWDNIQSIHLKTTSSAALQLFAQLPSEQSTQ